MQTQDEWMYHATALSNLALAHDKYAGTWDKSRLPHSHFPGQFFLLRRNELHIGLRKASALVARLGLPGDEVLVLATRRDPAQPLHPNLRTGLGQFIDGDSIKLAGLYRVDEHGQLHAWVLEEAMARSLAILHPTLTPYDKLRPRSLSVLPIARACQAKCLFCFSEASVSREQAASQAWLTRVQSVCEQARQAGASRFVITGGGEPGLLQHDTLVQLVRMGRAAFAKTVLISNGVHLARRDEAERRQRLLDYRAAGLSTLALSRHHADAAVNAHIMGLDTGTERVLTSLRALSQERPLQARLICVLQQGGVDSPQTLAAYLNWATEQGVSEICLKELYVASTLESVYAGQSENAWCRAHQVPLHMAVNALREWGFTCQFSLPWGSPVLAGQWLGQPLRVAAYTEPSLGWERSHGMARSWNLMANGQCLASLEDPHSLVCAPAMASCDQAAPDENPQTRKRPHRRIPIEQQAHACA